MKKHQLGLIFGVLLFLIVALLCAVDWSAEDGGISAAFSFTISNGDFSETLSPWSEDGKNYYVFFPSHAGLGEAGLQLHSGREMYLNGEPLAGEGFDFNALRLDTPYELSYSDHGTKRAVNLTFLQSANVATLYIHTKRGGMDKVHADKDHKENTRMVLVDAGGNIDYAGEWTDTIKGRGNSTWRYAKRPYLLQLREEHGMLGMPAARKWVLLSNSRDVSNLRNKLIYDFAEGMGFYWTPKCRYVDLYLNGEYSGLYLLTEKIEVLENRLDLNADALVFALETGVLAAGGDDWFSLESGLRVELSNPSRVSEKERHEIQRNLQEMEDSIIDGGEDLFERIDLDSWVRKYLIEEVFINVDAGRRSQYFYCDSRISGRVYAGPIWDYDLALGNHVSTRNPNCLYAAAARQTPVLDAPWYAALYGNATFFDRVVEVYETEYLPKLEGYIDHSIEDLAEEIGAAVMSNNLRWGSLFAESRPYREEVRYIRELLAGRIQFLNRLWIDGIAHYLVRGEAGRRYFFYSIEAGRTAESVPSPRELGISESDSWYIEGTDIPFDSRKPVTSDVYLRDKTESALEAETEALEEQEPDDWTLFAQMRAAIREDRNRTILIGGLLLALLALFAVDRRRNMRRGRRSM